LWIEPTTFFPERGESVGLKLWIGQNLVGGDPLPRVPSFIREFVVEDVAGRRPIVGRAGADPAGLLRPTTPGLSVIGYHSAPSTVDVTADVFNQYLKEEGLDGVAAERTRRRETNAGVHEQFSRCAKSLVLLGPTRDADGDRVLGFPLELIAEQNPYATRGAQDLSVRLIYENRPLAGALVVALNRSRLPARLAARSDRDGRVRFRLEPGGMWLIKAVHMLSARPGTNADWESFWASLTFGSVGAEGGPQR
jgi:hypothetical protein